MPAEEIHDLLRLICVFGWFILLFVFLTLPPGYLIFRFPKALKFLVPLFGLMLILISHDPPSFSLSAFARFRLPGFNPE